MVGYGVPLSRLGWRVVYSGLHYLVSRKGVVFMSKIKPEDHPDFVGGLVWTKLELDWINGRLNALENSLFQAQNAAIGLTAQLEIYEAALESIILCREDSLEAVKAKQALATVRSVVV